MRKNGITKERRGLLRHDVVAGIMWAIDFTQGNDSIAALLMWIAYLGNAAVMMLSG